MPAKMGDYEDPEEKKIEDKRKALKIPTPEDFKTKASRDALYRLNMKNSTKNDSSETTAKKYADETKAKPFVYKKGGKVIKGGMARVHTGEKVLTKKEASKRVACKR